MRPKQVYADTQIQAQIRQLFTYAYMRKVLRFSPSSAYLRTVGPPASATLFSLRLFRRKQQNVDSKDVSSVYFIAQQIHLFVKLLSVLVSTCKREVALLLLRLRPVSSKMPCLVLDRISRVSCVLPAVYARKPRALARLLDLREGGALCS